MPYETEEPVGGARMNPRVIGWIIGTIVFLVLIGGVGYKIVVPTSKTVIGKGGRQVIVNTEPPNIPLLGGGCSIWRMNMKTQMNWVKGFNLDKIKDKK